MDAISLVLSFGLGLVVAWLVMRQAPGNGGAGIHCDRSRRYGGGATVTCSTQSCS